MLSLLKRTAEPITLPDAAQPFLEELKLYEELCSSPIKSLRKSAQRCTKQLKRLVKLAQLYELTTLPTTQPKYGSSREYWPCGALEHYWGNDDGVVEQETATRFAMQSRTNNRLFTAMIPLDAQRAYKESRKHFKHNEVAVFSPRVSDFETMSLKPITLDPVIIGAAPHPDGHHVYFEIVRWGVAEDLQEQSE